MFIILSVIDVTIRRARVYSTRPRARLTALTAGIFLV